MRQLPYVPSEPIYQVAHHEPAARRGVDLWNRAGDIESDEPLAYVVTAVFPPEPGDPLAMVWNGLLPSFGHGNALWSATSALSAEELGVVTGDIDPATAIESLMADFYSARRWWTHVTVIVDSLPTPCLRHGGATVSIVAPIAADRWWALSDWRQPGRTPVLSRARPEDLQPTPSTA
ncbi:hypothetical protein [Solicola sp. PLA-1-18]|uniref:hypothetical protein n=1 Tax=Solicola sp. PLA-1-18 TaxID=3380532 RepID=UPI003B8116DD